MSRRPSLTDFSREGDFTPGIADDSLDGSGEGQAYTRQVGRWTKIGNRILFDLHVLISDLGTLTTSQRVRIVGFPYPANSITNSQSSVYVGFATSLALPNATEVVTGTINPDTDHIRLNKWSATTGTTILLISELSVGAQINISGHYEI